MEWHKSGALSVQQQTRSWMNSPATITGELFSPHNHSHYCSNTHLASSCGDCVAIKPLPPTLLQGRIPTNSCQPGPCLHATSFLATRVPPLPCTPFLCILFCLVDCLGVVILCCCCMAVVGLLDRDLWNSGQEVSWCERRGGRLRGQGEMEAGDSLGHP